ncbi:MAG: ABC transporter ATP-binding protein [Brevibacillus sp.]|nr:ABC transporter ATP-binding protein [Brevibacillus sp.]
MAEVVLSVAKLQKKLGGKTIIEDITFDVLAGEVFGFLGPNGAGKTTTIRMLTGLAFPDGGTIRIAGHSLTHDFPRAIRQVGCIVENPEMYKFLTGWENLEHFARMSGGISAERIEEVVHFVGLSEAINQKVKTYSLGMRQRLGIAQALLHKPKLLILDEPTNGLDPAGIRELRNFVRRLAEEEGLAVFVSSHLLSEIELMCDRVAIIHKGRVIFVGAVRELMAQYADQVDWRFADGQRESGVEVLQGLSFVSQVWSMPDGTVKCRMDVKQIGRANRELVRAGIGVEQIASRTVTLEELFLMMTHGGTEDGR